MANNRVTFGSKLGVVLATVGCAVGLGSVWLPVYAGSERRCGLPTGLHTFHDILGHSGNDNRVFHRPAFPQQYGGFFQENGSRYKMVLDWVQRYLGRIFDLKLLLGRLRLDA